MDSEFRKARGHRLAADPWREEVTCSRRSLLLFTRQFATLVGSGISILPCIEALCSQEDPDFERVILDLHAQVSSGKYLSSCLSTFPNVFPSTYLVTVKVAESTGGLTGALELLADWLEYEMSVLQKVKSALTYPALVLVCATAMALYIFCEVMPGFVAIFAEMKAELPPLTVVLIFVTNLVTHTWTWIAAAFLLTYSWIQGRRFLRTLPGQLWLYQLLLSLPIVSEVVRLLTLSRFCKSLSSMLRSGMYLHTSLKLACDSSGNPVLVSASEDILDAISSGESLSSYMSCAPELFPPVLSQVFAVGEETGQLESLSQKMAEMFQEDLESKLEKVTALFEPLLLLGASVAVCLVLLGVFMPLYSYLGSVGV